MSSLSTKKVSTIALLTSAVFAISSLAPIEFAPGPFSPDAAFAKSENGKGNGNGGGKGNGKGDEKSAANGGGNANKGGGQGGGKGGGKGLGKGVGGLFANATAKGGSLIKGMFGKDKAKSKSKTSGATTLAVVGPKLHPKLGQYGIHPSEAKGFNALFNANYHAWENAIKTGNSSKFSLGLDWLAANDVAATAAQSYADALADPLISGEIELLEMDAVDYEAQLAALATAKKALLQEDYDVLGPLLTEYNNEVALLDAELLTSGEYDIALAELDAEFTNDSTNVDGTSPADAATAVDTYEAWDSVLATQDTAEQTQADMETAFNNVTPNVTYEADLAAAFEMAIYDDPDVAEVINGYIDTQTAPATVVTTEEEVVLLDGDGETFVLVVE